MNREVFLLNRRARILEEYLKSPNICQHCGTTMITDDYSKVRDIRRKKFCSCSCAAKFNNKATPKRKKKGECRVCATPIGCNAKFCSPVCREKFFTSKRLTPEESKARISSRLTKSREVFKQRAVDLLGGKCVICGYCRCLWALCFHHNNPEEKDFTISLYIRKWESVELELKKCSLLCSNCHWEVHAGLIALPQLN